jgi:hypothetical protein
VGFGSCAYIIAIYYCCISMVPLHLHIRRWKALHTFKFLVDSVAGCSNFVLWFSIVPLISI